MKPRIALILVAGLLALLAGCSAPPQEQPSADEQGEGGNVQAPQSPQQPSPAKTALKPSESATKIYVGMLQAGLEEAVVDVKSDEVLIACIEDSSLNSRALAYYAFGLAQQYEPSKKKTTVLIFSGKNIALEASADQADIKALKDGSLSDAEFSEKVRWMQ